MLFNNNDISTFQQYINVQFTFDVNNTFDGLLDAEQDVLVPVIGETLYAALNTIVANNDNATNKDLLALCRRVVAPASVLIALPLKVVRIGTSGLSQVVAEGQTPITQWQYRQTEESLKNKISIALNDLWKYLYTNATALSWTNPNVVVSIFTNADDFINYYPLHQPYRIFPLLQPVIGKVENLWIYGAIGQAFYKELLAYTGTDTNTLEAIRLLKNAIANFTIHKSTTDLPVNITPQGFTVLFGREGDQPYKGTVAASDKTMSALRDTTLNDARIYMGQLKTLLNTNASDSVFATYFASKYYENKRHHKIDRNKFRNGVFHL